MVGEVVDVRFHHAVGCTGRAGAGSLPVRSSRELIRAAPQESTAINASVHTRTTSDAKGSLHVTAAPGDIGRYRFGRRVVDAIMCRECGCYIGSFLTLKEGVIATLNVAGTDLEGFAGRVAEPVTYDHETDDEKLARRRAKWTPAILVEATPSA